MAPRPQPLAPLPSPAIGSRPVGPARLTDAFGRTLTYLRVSITDRCNLRCSYCLPADAPLPFGDRDLLAPEEVEAIVGALVRLGIRRLRITGGEPLVRKDVVEIAARLGALPGVEDLALSTNGTELARLAGELRAAGVRRVNVSLDSLDPERFHAITGRGDLDRVWQGIEAALVAGLAPVKLNVVLLAGQNLAEVERFAALTIDRPLTVRFIERMPTGANRAGQSAEFVSCAEARRAIEERWGPLAPAPQTDRSGPAETFRLPAARGKVGFITPLSHTFCRNCNRLRLTARGELRLCLFADRTFPLRHLLAGPQPSARLEAEVLRVLAAKPEEHHLLQGDSGNLMSFVQIGG